MDHLEDLRRQLLIRAQSAIAAKPALKYVLLAQLAALFIGLLSPVSDLLVLVPSSLFRLHLWRLVTNLFAESNLIVMLWSIYCFQQFLLYIEPNWPWKESVKYAIIVQFGSLFSLVISALILYIFTGLVYPFYYDPISGTSALGMAALVALKQFIPDTVLLTTLVGRLKNGHLPFSSILISMLLWLFGLLRGTVPFQMIFSAQISWTYLRFFQSRGGMPEPMVGDRSEHFTWASLFPRRMQPLTTLLGRLTFRSLARMGILRRVMRSEHLSHIEEETLQMEALHAVKVVDATTAVLAPESWDAERKRQKALRMLNERLAATVGGSAPSPPPPPAIFGAHSPTPTEGSYRMMPGPDRPKQMMEENYAEGDRRLLGGGGDEEEEKKRREPSPGDGEGTR